jgi:hypothetical protein
MRPLRYGWDGPPNEPFDLNPDAPDAPGLLAWWPALASRGSATTWRDLAGSNHLALNGGVEFTASGEMGWALGCDGSNDYAESAASDLFEAHSKGTVTAWVRFTAFATYNDVWSSWIPGTPDGLFLVVNASGQPYIQRYRAATGLNEAFRSTTSLSLNTWYHLAVTSNGSTWAMFVNGRPQTLVSDSGSNNGRWFSDLTVSGHKFRVGRTDTTYVTGQVAEVRIYDRAAPQSELAWQCDPMARWNLARALRQRPLWVYHAPPVSILLRGTAGGAGGTTATLQTSRRITGSAAGLAVTSATPQVSRRLVVTGGGASTGAGTLSVQRPLTGTAAGVGTSAGSCQLSRLCTGTSAGVGAVSGTPTFTRALSGRSSGSGATTAVPTISRSLSGSAAGVGATTAAVEIQRLLAGFSAGGSGTSGVFYKPPILLSALCAGVGGADGRVTVSRPLQAAGTGEGVVTGTLLLRRLLTGTAAGVGTTRGTLFSIAPRGPICYGGAVQIATSYGGTCTLRITYRGSVTIRTRYGGSVEICGDE